MKENEEWIYHLSEHDLAELEIATKAALQATSGGALLHHLTSASDFPLPTLGPTLDKIRKDVSFGRGFALVKGIPVGRWSRKETVTAYYGIGLHWGNPKSNNKKGHLVGHIKDIGHDPDKPDTRLYATAAPQPYHNDAADLVALLCLHNAKEGGTSHWSSSISVHNAIVTSHRPCLGEVLAGAWYFDRKGEIPAGKKPFFEIPVFNYHAGTLSINYSENYFILSQRHEEVPRLTEVHHEAMRVFSALAEDDEFRMDYMLQPGDIQLLSNHTCLHARDGFVDHEDPEKRRHLLRLWLAPEDERSLPEVYEDILGGSVEPGKRGGIVCEDTELHVPLEAE